MKTSGSEDGLVEVRRDFVKGRKYLRWESSTNQMTLGEAREMLKVWSKREDVAR